MARTAGLRVTVDRHANAVRIAGVQAAGTVTGFALHTGRRPGAHNPFQVVLVAGGVVAGGIANAAVGLQALFARVVGGPVGIVAGDDAGEVVLVLVLGVRGGGARRVSDNIDFLVYEGRLSVVTADDISDVIPRIAVGRVYQTGEGGLWRLAIVPGLNTQAWPDCKKILYSLD